MRLNNETELANLLSKGSCKIAGKGSNIVTKLSLPQETTNAIAGKSLTLILPFKLPTWNQLLAMNNWQRGAVAKWIKERVLECIQNGADWQTPTGLVRKLQLTDLCLLEYSQMTIPNTSKTYRLRKKLAKLKKQ